MIRRALLTGLWLTAASSADGQELSDTCPANHQLEQDGTCKLVTLYDFYTAPQAHGGVRTPLPPAATTYTPQQIDLGRFLFFDPVLSANKDMSCASCHQLENGLADGRKRSLGAMQADGRMELHRSTPTIWNAAYQTRFMWDGRAETLEEQALLPLFSEEEMGNTREGIESDLGDIQAYVSMFDEAFGAEPTVENVATALAAFQSSLVSFDSRYDRYAHGDENALTEQEKRGYSAFRGFVGRCTQCHIPPLFTDSELPVVGAPANDLGYVDDGAGALTDDPTMTGAFKVPTLRNITKTAPYFHSGQFSDLNEVLEFYNNTRGHMAPEGQELQIHWHVHMTKGPALSEQNMADIVAFLGSLEDETKLPQPPETLPSGLTPVPGL